MLGLIVEQVPGMLASEDWRRRHAALMAVSSAGEGCHKQMEQMLDQVVSAVLNYLTDPVSNTLIIIGIGLVQSQSLVERQSFYCGFSRNEFSM